MYSGLWCINTTVRLSLTMFSWVIWSLFSLQRIFYDFGPHSGCLQGFFLALVKGPSLVCLEDQMECQVLISGLATSHSLCYCTGPYIYIYRIWGGYFTLRALTWQEDPLLVGWRTVCDARAGAWCMQGKCPNLCTIVLAPHTDLFDWSHSLVVRVY